MDNAIAYQTIGQLARRLEGRELSSRELVAACLGRIEALNPKVNAFLTIAADHALQRADRADAQRRRGRRLGPLHGIPYAVKDVISTRGIPTTDGSRVSRPREDVDAAVVARLDRAGAVLIGKLNLWEFASVGSVFSEARNPWNLAYSASGSSGGAAAAVSAGMVPLAIGTDTGGSIRVPAAHCGVVGLRPTYGRVSRFGVTPNAWSVDAVGPFARSAADVALVFRAISGPDPADPPTAASRPAVPGRPGGRRWTFGLVRACFDGAHPDVGRGVMSALRELERTGSRLVDVDVPHVEDAALARTLHLAESAAFHEARLRDPRSPFGPELRARLEAAQSFPAVSYIKALRLRTVLMEETARAFERCDLLAMPTDRGVPRRVAGDSPTPAEPPAAGPNTFLASMTGEPAIAIPCGFSTSPAGLPVSLMLQAPAHRDEALFAAATAFQMSTDWHERHPDL